MLNNQAKTNKNGIKKKKNLDKKLYLGVNCQCDLHSDFLFDNEIILINYAVI
jgi:hypothetical protein